MRGALLTAILALAASPALAQTLGQGQSPDIPVWRVTSALILCVLLALGAAYVLRNRLGGGPLWPLPAQARKDRRLQLVETLRLSHQVDVCLFRCDDRDYLIAATPHGAVVLEGGQAPAPLER